MYQGRGVAADECLNLYKACLWRRVFYSFFLPPRQFRFNEVRYAELSDIPWAGVRDRKQLLDEIVGDS